MKFKTVEEVAAAITVRNYLNMIFDNAGIKLDQGFSGSKEREEYRKLTSLPDRIDKMIIASVVDVFSDKDPLLAGNVDSGVSVNVSKLKEMLDVQEELEDKPKKGSFKRSK